MGLKVDRVSKRYGNTWALRDVELDIPEGEVFGILGDAASGKTSLLKIIAGCERSNGGSISLDGREFSSNYFSSNNDERGLFGIFGKGKASPCDIPAIMGKADADVILLDEPFADCSHQAREQALDAIRGAKGRTVIVASDSFTDLAEVCTRLAVLVAGVVGQTGFVQQVYDSPISAGVARATGPMDLFDARRLTSTNAALPEFFTIEGEHRLFAQSTAKAALGPINQTISLGIRPEHISITTGASFPEDNLLKAVVRDIRFLGSCTRVRLDAAGLTLNACVPRVVGLNVGEECMIAMPPHLIHVFRD